MGQGIGEGEGERLRPQFTPYWRSEARLDKGEQRTSLIWKIFFIILIAACIVGLAMIVVGALHVTPLTHKGETWEWKCTSLERCGCHGEPMLPWYLIIGGILTIVLVIIRLVIHFVCKSLSSRKRQKTLACRLGEITCLSLYDILALVITGCWLIAGSVFLHGLYQRVNYETQRPNQDTCDWGLYWFFHILIFLGWIFLLICLVCGLLLRFSRSLCCREKRWQ